LSLKAKVGFIVGLRCYVMSRIIGLRDFIREAEANRKNEYWEHQKEVLKKRKQRKQQVVESDDNLH
jgi:hypothetical protein